MKNQAKIKKYHIGTTQWGLQDWAGVFYTDRARPDQFLEQYASVFNAVEGNTTFYRAPKTETIEKWGADVPNGFKFCFKFPQGITHYRRLKDTDHDVLRFIDLFEPIRTKLGPFHIQLSSQFSFNEFPKLEHLLSLLPAHHNYAVEVRHPDYFDKGKQEREFEDALRYYGINRVIFDTRKLHGMKSDDESVIKAQKKKPKTPVRFSATGNHPFVRYVGSNDVLNNEAYLKEWAIIIADWINDGLHPYIFIHAPNTLHAPQLVRYFHNQLSTLIELNPMPDNPVDRQNEQLGLF